MHKLCFFVPHSHLEAVKEAAFSEGAGHFNNYDRCCWQTSGSSQFRALPGSKPYIGQEGRTERIDEVKVEMICKDELLEAVIATIRHAHPYEEPALEAWPIRHFPDTHSG